MSKTSFKGEGRLLIVSVCFGVAVTLIVLIIFAAIISALIEKGSIGEETEEILTVASVCTASIIGSFIAKLKSKKNALIVCVTTSLIFLFIRILLSIFFGKDRAMDQVDTTIIIASLCGGILPALIKIKKKKRKR